MLQVNVHHTFNFSTHCYCPCSSHPDTDHYMCWLVPRNVKYWRFFSKQVDIRCYFSTYISLNDYWNWGFLLTLVIHIPLLWVSYWNILIIFPLRYLFLINLLCFIHYEYYHLVTCDPYLGVIFIAIHEIFVRVR